MSASENVASENKQSQFPNWIESKLFESVLRDVEADFKEIDKFHIDHALAPGENFATVMLKVEIVMKLKDDTLKPISFMMKIGHDTEFFHEMIKVHNFFNVEATIYRDILAEFEQLYSDVGVEVKFAAKSYELPTQQPYLLLENLKVRGFKNINRLEGLDMEHSKSVLKKLAQWHAASAVRVVNKGMFDLKLFTAFLKPEGYEFIREMYESKTQIILEAFKEYDNSDLYYEKLAKLQLCITEETFKCSDLDSNEFNILNHGDCWSNNIMFKHDENGKLVDTYLVDFQLARYGTPALDLLYFILSSTKLEIKLKEFDYFIKYYHDHLCENLKLLKYSKAIPTLRDIHIMLYKYDKFAYMTVTICMAAVLCDPCDDANLDNFMSSSEESLRLQKQMYSNARYRKHMEAILPWFLYRGVLDC